MPWWRFLYLRIKAALIKPDCLWCELSGEPSWCGRCELCEPAPIEPDSDHGVTDAELERQELSALAEHVYAAAGAPGAYVMLADGQFELHEPSPNAFPVRYATAAECRAAIEDSGRTFEADADAEGRARLPG